MTTGRELLIYGKSESSTPPAIFANPDFDLAPAQVARSTEAVLRRTVIPTRAAGFLRIPAVASLPGTAAEAAFVSPSLEKWSESKPALYEGRFATEGVLRSIHGPRALLLSTHGFFLKGDENELRNPLLQSGILLAGVNRREDTSTGDDGVVTGLEILLTDFRGTELVILSACDTSLGTIQSGEGVAGLRQAFQQAGARSVVSTLWPIPDRDSALLMVDFVAALVDGESKAQALRTAQRKRIESRRQQNGAAHPLFWGAWTITGG